MAVTLRDIANLAGVDPSAVSAVLNGSRRIRVSPERRKRILELAESMNYRVNISARSLITRRNYSVGVLLCSTRDRFYAEMIGELQCQLAGCGYTGIFGFWSNADEIPVAYESVLSRGVDAVISCHGDRGLLPAGLPALIYGETVPELDCFGSDWEYLIGNSVRYLYELGHRQIGYVGYRDGEIRSRIFRRLIEELRLEWNPAWTAPGAGLAADALEGARGILSLHERPTALLARNDTAAIASICVAASLGIRVPEELSVIGIDNIEESGYSNPPLTTSGLPMKLLVTKMLERLFARLENPALPVEHAVFRPELIVRGSCGKKEL